MPFTAPATTTRKELTMQWVDDSGDTTTQRIPIRPSLTNGQIQSLVADIAATSSANLYRYDVCEVHASPKDASVALDGEQNSVYDTAIVLFKREDTKQSFSVIMPAFREALMVEDTDDVDTSEAIYVTARNAYNSLLADEFAPVSVRYTERRESNTKSLPA